VHLGLDDFGTGWSSLSQLARLPFDFVKIDRSFVRDLRRDERTAALLESIVGLCATLGLHVIVEGVETSSQLDQLKQLDVRLVQGFLLGRPVPPEALA
jgi:EAL domain-containing protein (putative c-di-GMP-specific phosphodiesterase class I)